MVPTGKGDGRAQVQGSAPPVSCLWHTVFGEAATLIGTGKRNGKLELPDLWHFDYDPQVTTSEIRALWAEERRKPKPKLARILRGLSKTLVVRCCVIQLAGAVFQISAPLILNQILKSIEYRQGARCGADRGDLGWQGYLCEERSGYILVACLLVANVCRGLCSTWSQVFLMKASIKLRGGLIGVIFEKSLRLSCVGMSETGAGPINNLATNDAEQFLQSVPVLGQIVAAPVLVIGAMTLLGATVGPSFLGGFAAMILIFVLCGIAASTYLKMKLKQLKYSDSRIGITNEMLAGVRIVKAYGWEEPLEEAVMKVRRQETWLLMLQQMCIAIIVVVIQCAPVVLGVVTFSIYAAAGNEMRPSTIFTALALLNAIRFPMAFLPFAFFTVLKILVSVMRIQNLLEADESDGVLTAARPGGGGEATVDGSPTVGGEAPHLLTPRRSASELWLSNAGGDGNSARGLPAIVDAEFGYPMPEKRNIDPKGKGKGKGKGLPCFGRLRKAPKGGGKGKGGEGGKGGKGEGAEAEEIDPELLAEVKREDGKMMKVRRALAVEHLEPLAGGLTMVVGPVGSGKSSLLSVWIGEIAVLKGVNYSVTGQVAYVAQQPWIINGTVERNIKFAAERQDADGAHYQKVLEACCITEDLEAMPAGDKTEIGERGINLSGGQRARVSLARACFSDKSVYLLDDPLSAVDAHVGNHLFQHVLGPAGLLSGRTRVLVTHQVQFLARADRIVVIEGGKITAMGTYDALNAGGSLDSLGSWAQGQGDGQSREEGSGQNGEDAAQQPAPAEAVPSKAAPAQGRAKPALTSARTVVVDPKKQRGTLLDTEEKEVGTVSLRTYKDFIKHGWGYDILCLIIVAFSLVVAVRLCTDRFLVAWTDPSQPLALSTGEYIGFYMGLLVCLAISVYIRAISVNCIALNRVCGRTYKRLLRSVFGSPVVFFDVTPIGRVLNRFTADMDILDNQLASMIGQFSGCLEGCTVVVIGITIFDPMVLFATIPCVAGYVYVTNHARVANRDIQRLEATTKSPIFNSISETLGGLSTVRAYGYQGTITRAMFQVIRDNQACNWLKALVINWLTLRLEMMSVLVSTTCALLPLLPSKLDTANASMVGLALSYTLDLSVYVQACIKSANDIEQKFTSIERIFEYCALPQEPPHLLPGDKTLVKKHGAWPALGGLEFRDVSMRYRPELEPALNGLSFTVEAGKKLGIVGRTGSGKSSLIVTLLRLREAEAGQVLIDGQDLTGVGLRMLRRSVAMIPQEPILFGKASVRHNLDPSSDYSNEEVEAALREVRMDGKDVVPQGIQTELQEGGSSFSVGQRQLLCMARAVLRKSRLLLLDEATASVDNVTDEAIQQTIRKVFASSTVLCVAHRIRTIMDSDLILVMGQGRCVELGSPSELLASKDSHFRALAVESKIEVPDTN